MAGPKIGAFVNRSVTETLEAPELDAGDQGTVAPDLPHGAEAAEYADAALHTANSATEPTPETDPAVFVDMGNNLEWDDPSRGGIPPDPPKCVQQRLKNLGRGWRWMSVPHVRKLGMRNYESVSLTKEEKRAIRNGTDIGHPTISIGVDNTLRWREDSWLASCPLRLVEARERLKRQRTIDQTKLSLSTEETEENMKRTARNKGIKGFKVKIDVAQGQGDPRMF